MPIFALDIKHGVALNLFRIFVLLILTFYSQESIAQSQLKDFSSRRSVKQDNMQMIFFVRDEDKIRPNSLKNDTWYHWFKSQKIMTTQGGADGLLLEGLFTAFFSNKQLAQKGKFKKGLKVRSWEYWRKDGTLKMTEKWRGGSLVQVKSHDEKGVVFRIEKKSFGKNKIYTKDSVWIYKHDELVNLKTYSSDDKLITKANYKNGVLNGTYKMFEKGKLISKSNYKNGEVVPKKEDSEEELDKEPSKFISFWKNLFKKKEKEDLTKEEDEK